MLYIEDGVADLYPLNMEGRHVMKSVFPKAIHHWRKKSELPPKGLTKVPQLKESNDFDSLFLEHNILDEYEYELVIDNDVNSTNNDFDESNLSFQ